MGGASGPSFTAEGIDVADDMFDLLPREEWKGWIDGTLKEDREKEVWKN